MWIRRDELGRERRLMESGALMYEWRPELLANKWKSMGGKSKSEGQGPFSSKGPAAHGQRRTESPGPDCTQSERLMSTWMLLDLKLLLPSTRLGARRHYANTSPVAHHGSPGRCKVASEVRCRGCRATAETGAEREHCIRRYGCAWRESAVDPTVITL
jgi:hypothetical protein